MIDLSFIGKDGLIIQYEDIISLWGYNVILQLKEKMLVQGMSDEDILLDYFNREIQDPCEYIKQKYHIVFPIDSMYTSKKTLRPNMMYAFKILDAAFKNGMKNLQIYSHKKSEVISKYISSQLPDIPIKYVYGDIVPIIEVNPNATFLTSDVHVVNEIAQSKVPPFALTIVDDFMYAAPIVQDEFVNKLRQNGIFVGFTGIISAGLIP